MMDKWQLTSSGFFLAAVAVLISRAKEKAENLKMDQALERYKREE